MAPIRRPLAAVLLLFFSLSCLISTAFANEKKYIKGTGIDGIKRELEVSRQPSLFTGDFNDCMGGESLFNVTKFDVAYYADNSSVLFHLDGSTNIRKESIMLHIAVDAYGENRFNLTYEPCKGNISSLCPLNVSVPVTAFAVIPIAPKDVTGIPSIAIDVPDLEGFARLRIFANSTRTQIGCFQAVMRNGRTLSQPESVGTILAVFTLLAILASFATAIYGLSVPHMRTHYAHSFSALVIFETFQAIFFSGALSVNWPSILPAWWSNFAWTAGMFANSQIVDALNSFAGNSRNSSQVGGAGSVPLNNGGGLSQQIYGRSLFVPPNLHQLPAAALARRADYNPNDPYDYNWNGQPQTPGLPMPGTWPGFGGTLSSVNIPPAEAFTIGLMWLMVLLAGVALFIVAFKLMLDLLVKTKLLKSDGFDYFRSHVMGYMAAGLLRTLFIAFFTMMTLAMYQFSLNGPVGPTAISVVVFVIFVVGMGGLAAYACYFRLRDGKYDAGPDTVRFEAGKLFKKVPFVTATRSSRIGEEEAAEKPRLFGSMPIFRVGYTDNNPSRATVHQDEGYIKRFGWLSARYRRSRWWFFAVYLGYQFVRACFVGGAARSPLAQVYGLFVFEIFALFAIIKMRPFESSRNATVSIWLLSISKIITTGLSIAFLPDFNLDRMVATILGIIIIVVQGFLAVVIVILVILGMISTWMSLSRNHEDFSASFDGVRIKYFEHLAAQAGDEPPKHKDSKVIEEPAAEPYFNVKDVRRAPKIEDDEVDEDEIAEVPENESIHDGTQSAVGRRRSRANSASSRYSTSSLPRAARVHRACWSSRDFAQMDMDMGRADSQRMSHSRSNSMRIHALRNGGIIAPQYDFHGPAGHARKPMTPAVEYSEDQMMNFDEKRDDDKGEEEKAPVTPVTPVSPATDEHVDEAGVKEKDSHTLDNTTKAEK